jgi:hypothetical protein
VRLRRPVLVLSASLLWGCDPVPDLYVVDGSVDTGSADATAAFDAADSGQDAAEGGAQDAAAEEACVGVSCPACAPNPGQCCPSGIPCLGNSCATDCDAGCAACDPGEMCCSKQGGQPVCRSIDAGKCPP